MAEDIVTRILEDDDDDRDLLGTELTRLGLIDMMDYFFHATQIEIVDGIDDRTYVIVLDYKLPISNGLETLYEIKKKFPKREFFFIVMTEFATGELFADFTNAGANRLIIKKGIDTDVRVGRVIMEGIDFIREKLEEKRQTEEKLKQKDALLAKMADRIEAIENRRKIAIDDSGTG